MLEYKKRRKEKKSIDIKFNRFIEQGDTKDYRSQFFFSSFRKTQGTLTIRRDIKMLHNKDSIYDVRHNDFFIFLCVYFFFFFDSFGNKCNDSVSTHFSSLRHSVANGRLIKIHIHTKVESVASLDNVDSYNLPAVTSCCILDSLHSHYQMTMKETFSL